MAGTVRISESKLAGVLARVRAMSKKRCLVGIPSSAAARDDGSTINNAEIGFINEFGAPEQNIPPRPHLVPGVRKAQPTIIALLESGGRRVINGGTEDVGTSLEKTGLVAINSVKALITEGIAPPLAPATIAARRKGNEEDNGATPLVDTGNYMAHLTYVVRDQE